MLHFKRSTTKTNTENKSDGMVGVKELPQENIIL